MFTQSTANLALNWHDDLHADYILMTAESPDALVLPEYCTVPVNARSEFLTQMLADTREPLRVVGERSEGAKSSVIDTECHRCDLFVASQTEAHHKPERQADDLRS